MHEKKKISLILGAVCVILTLAIIIQIKTIKSTIKTIDPTFVENGLRDEVLKWKEKYDNCFFDLNKAEKQLEEVRAKTTQNDSSLKEKEEQLKLQNTYMGLTDITGKGISITIKDNQTINSDTIGLGDNIGDYVVHDLDILSIVNELKNAGAEAISINDKRLIPTSSITCGGVIAQINGEKIGSPFIIKAIGLQEALYENLMRPGGFLEELNKVGILKEVKKVNNLFIEKYSGVINYKYAKELK